MIDEFLFYVDRLRYHGVGLWADGFAVSKMAGRQAKRKKCKIVAVL